MRPDTIIGNPSEILNQIRTGLRTTTLNSIREVLSDRELLERSGLELPLRLQS